MIKSLDKGKPALLIKCTECGTDYESKYIRGHMQKYLKEFSQYENHVTTPCPECGAIQIINLNLPPEELTETFFEEVKMAQEEIQQRRAIIEFSSDITFEAKS